MWTWQFQLDDILTTLSIVAIIGGASYRLLILPILTRISEERMQDNLIFTERMNKLNETLVDLKDEIKLSREQRTKEYAERVKLTARVDALDNRVDDIKEELHEHTTKSHQYA
ncbi:hypothetical protein [Veillonella sp.]|uniref:hypothetical protein n=1 Tax=Veillonella sp. TaxID=1926307 RepID=UPI0025E3DF6F|nr:hypothetical protein [Veillonella sp.]